MAATSAPLSAAPPRLVVSVAASRQPACRAMTATAGESYPELQLVRHSPLCASTCAPLKRTQSPARKSSNQQQRGNSASSTTRKVTLSAFRLRGLGRVPQCVHLFEGRVFRLATRFRKLRLDAFETPHEFCVGVAQRGLRIDLEMTPDYSPSQTADRRTLRRRASPDPSQVSFRSRQLRLSAPQFLLRPS